ncbi:MAG: RNA polymerase sigma-70 factor, partial [Bacteroidota bacterium]
MSYPEEKILVGALKKGNSQAFEALFYRYYGKVYNFTHKLLKDEGDAENMVQEVFITVWEKRNSIDAHRSFSGFLFTITRNKIYNLLKKKVPVQEFNDQMENTGSYNRSPSRDFEFHELNEVVRGIIDSLPPKRKKIFLLSRIRGLTYREIADKLGISVNTVDTQVRKSLNEIRISLKKFYP